MATSPNSRPHNRKRRYTEVELSQDDLPSKRFKPPPAFWDNLSEIPLTRSALKELERRYNLSNRPYVQPKVKKPRTRSAVREFKQKAHPVPVSEYLSTVVQADIALLKVFATQQRRGGPDLTNLRGYSGHIMSSSRSSSKRRRSTDPSSATSKTRKSTTPYDRGFEQNLIDHGVYLDNRAKTPENFDEINKRLAKPRPSLSPSKFSEAAFKAFQASDFRAKDEDDVMIDVVPVITGTSQNNHFLARTTKFGNLDPLTDGTIAPANPDLFYGARPEQLDRRIRNELSGQIIPSTTEDKPIAPNFFLEVKGPDGSLAVAKRQACYNGALGARGIQSLQSYKQDKMVYDGKAYTITSTYHGGTLKICTTHITPPTGPGKPPSSQMTQINTWGLTGNYDTFLQGAAAFRNGEDLAKEWRDGFISAANERVDSPNAEPSTLESSNNSPSTDTHHAEESEESETSADELAYPAKETKISADETVFTSFSRHIEDELEADGLPFAIDAKLTASKKRPRMKLKILSEDQRPFIDASRRGVNPRIRTLRNIEGTRDEVVL